MHTIHNSSVIMVERDESWSIIICFDDHHIVHYKATTEDEALQALRALQRSREESLYENYSDSLSKGEQHGKR